MNRVNSKAKASCVLTSTREGLKQIWVEQNKRCQYILSLNFGTMELMQCWSDTEFRKYCCHELVNLLLLYKHILIAGELL